MKILIINQPLNNRGDESAHKALVRMICKEIPNAQIQVLFVGANANSVLQFNVNIPNVQYINLNCKKAFYKIAVFGLKHNNFHFLWNLHPTIREIIRIYNNTDYVLCAPGGICMGGFQNWLHLFFLKLSKYCKKPLFYYGRSFGPFPTKTLDNQIFKKISIEMLHYFSFLSIRDKKTEDIAKSLNIKYVPTVDSAFLDSPQVAIPNEILSLISNKKYMVFVPNLLIWHYAYKNLNKETILTFYSNIIDIILNKYPDINIVMLPQTFNYKTYEGDDINLFKEISQIKKDKRIIVIPDIYSSDIQQTIISKALFLIGVRYHSIVFAINNNIPFIALSYEHKISGLLETLHKTDSLIDISNMTNDKAVTDNILSKIKELIIHLEKDNETKIRAQNNANECFQQLYNFLTSKKTIM